MDLVRLEFKEYLIAIDRVKSFHYQISIVCPELALGWGNGEEQIGSQEGISSSVPQT